MPQTDITKVGVKWWTWDFYELNDHIFKEKINLKIKKIYIWIQNLNNIHLYLFIGDFDKNLIHLYF